MKNKKVVLYLLICLIVVVIMFILNEEIDNSFNIAFGSFIVSIGISLVFDDKKTKPNTKLLNIIEFLFVVIMIAITFTFGIYHKIRIIYQILTITGIYLLFISSNILLLKEKKKRKSN